MADKHKILIVEDDKYIINFISMSLKKEDYDYVIAKTCGEANALFYANRPDMIILDLGLPDGDGIEIIKNVREISKIPIIVVSARQEEEEKIQALDLGADDYITKPFSPNELVARVKAHLNRYIRLTRKRIDVNEYIEYPGLKIDKSARRVFVNEEERFFTTKEFDLLTYLATHPNHVFSKDELFSAVWGMDSMGEIATVTVHIKKIRKKTENANVKSGYIETVWGSGYRFRVIDSDVSGERESIVDAI